MGGLRQGVRATGVTKARRDEIRAFFSERFKNSQDEAVKVQVTAIVFTTTPLLPARCLFHAMATAACVCVWAGARSARRIIQQNYSVNQDVTKTGTRNRNQ